MVGNISYYTRQFRSRMEPIAMRELYVSVTGLLLANEDRADAHIVGELRSLHSAYCKVYDEWEQLTNRRF